MAAFISVPENPTADELGRSINSLHACLHLIVDASKEDVLEEVRRVRHDGRNTAQRVEAVSLCVAKMEGREQAREPLYNAIGRQLGTGVQVTDGTPKKTLGAMSLRKALVWMVGAIVTGAVAGTGGYKLAAAVLSAVHASLMAS